MRRIFTYPSIFFVFLKGLTKSFFQKTEKMDYPIDFVLLFVDSGGQNQIENEDSRLIDRDSLRFWFRGVEKYAPWVRYVYFVTCGQIPPWLDTAHPKIRLINQNDFIDEKYLPTINPWAIEVNLHKIYDLSEHFVYFNEGILLTNFVKPEDFFQGGKPLVCAAGYPLRNSPRNPLWNHSQFTILGAFKKLDLKEVIFRKPEKWFNVRYGNLLRYNFRMLDELYMSGIFDTHLSSSFKKSTLEKCWELFPDELRRTTSHKCRTYDDVSQTMVKLLSIYEGDFVPCSRVHYGQSFHGLKDIHKAATEAIRKQTYKMIGLNDSDGHITGDNIDSVKESLNEAIESIFTDKSSFEL